MTTPQASVLIAFMLFILGCIGLYSDPHENCTHTQEIHQHIYKDPVLSAMDSGETRTYSQNLTQAAHYGARLRSSCDHGPCMSSYSAFTQIMGSVPSLSTRDEQLTQLSAALPLIPHFACHLDRISHNTHNSNHAAYFVIAAMQSIMDEPPHASSGSISLDLSGDSPSTTQP
jgi:hypothetical protein